MRLLRSLASTLLCLILGIQLSFSQKNNDSWTQAWKNPLVAGINRQLPQNKIFSYPDETSAQTLDPTQSEYVKLLNGDWRLLFIKGAINVSDVYMEKDYDVATWNTVFVPSHWEEMENFDPPVYMQEGQLPFEALPPFIPEEENVVGFYRKNFSVPDSWKKRRTLIHFDGVRGAFYLWLNGKQIGFHQGSKQAAIFDISNYLKPGENQLGLQVYSWSAGSYLEQYEGWDMHGITRDVYLTSHPDVYSQDIKVNYALNNDFSVAQIEVDALIRNTLRRTIKSPLIKVSLRDSEGKEILNKESSGAGTIEGESNSSVKVKLYLQEPELWDTENPNQYTILTEIRDEKDVVQEVYAQKIGLRKIECARAQIYLNGKPLTVKGVHIPEWDQKGGEVVSEASMLHDIRTLKQHNFNTVILSYQHNPRFYQLCDEYGLYIIQDLGIASGASWEDQLPFWSEANWAPAIIDRSLRAVSTLYNHPSVLIWSAGKVAGAPDNLAQMLRAVHKNDEKRPVLLGRDVPSLISELPFVDLWQFPWEGSAEELEGLPGPKLLNVDIAKYGDDLTNIWAEVEDDGRFQGWVLNQWKNTSWKKGTGAANKISAQKENYLTYADGNPGAILRQLKSTLQPIRLRPIELEKGKFELTHDLGADDWSKLELVWRLNENQEYIQDGKINLSDLPFSQRQALVIPFELPEDIRYREYGLDLQFQYRSPSNWAQQGYVLASKQYNISAEPRKAVRPRRQIIAAQTEAPFLYFERMSELRVNDRKAGEVAISGKDMRVVFSKASGGLKSLAYKGVAILDGGKAAVTELEGIQTEIEVTQEKPQLVQVKVNKYIPAEEGGLDYQQTYSFLGSGDILLEYQYMPRAKAPALEHKGWQGMLAAAMSEFSWIPLQASELSEDYQTAAMQSLSLVDNSKLSKLSLACFRATDANGIGLEWAGYGPFAIQAKKSKDDETISVLWEDKQATRDAADLGAQVLAFSLRLRLVDAETPLYEDRHLPLVVQPQIIAIPGNNPDLWKISLQTPTKGADLYFRMGNTSLQKYSSMIEIPVNTEIGAKAVKAGYVSSQETRVYISKPADFSTYRSAN